MSYVSDEEYDLDLGIVNSSFVDVLGGHVQEPIFDSDSGGN